jgi:alcohol dehydrogenase class IV
MGASSAVAAIVRKVPDVQTVFHHGLVNRRLLYDVFNCKRKVALAKFPRANSKFARECETSAIFRARVDAYRVLAILLKFPAILALLGFNAMGDAIRELLDARRLSRNQEAGPPRSISLYCYDHG